MDTRRDFIRKASLLSGGAGFLNVLPSSIAKALAIDPQAGSTFMDAEHVVLLMQENRSFDHTYGTLQGVRGYNDPRAITLPDKSPVWLQSNSKGETFAPFRLDIKNTKATWMESLPHGWTDQTDARNNGKYDKWLDSKHSGVDEFKDMPLTLGYYTREDIPFYYSLADAFTVCDHNFCSSLTGTTPNRLYFWTGTIREEQDEKAMAKVWNSDVDGDSPANWKTFPERLEENGISWKVYQNEIEAVNLNDEEDAWLSNFGDNPLEYFPNYKVKSSPDQLSGIEKKLHEKAFTTNKNDPDFHDLTPLNYKDGDKEHSVNVPKGDVLFQFRDDVKNGTLPAVSWIIAPQKFSDHPSSAWYGAWYISEVMDILTHNPEVWKKTIFILTYDENDGYFDHVPPFTAPHPHNKETGAVSKDIDTGVEYVSDAKQQSSDKDDMRVGPIGLGFRVPMVIASPWSRGGWVNSQVFDHTSSLLFLEKFLSAKSGKKIHEPNISKWRRTVCGDLTSAFRPYNGEKINTPAFLERDEFIEAIHKAQFRNVPSNFKKISPEDIEKIKQDATVNDIFPEQEKGTRESNALPYELYADGKLSEDRKTFVIKMAAGNKIHARASIGSPFNVYAPGKYKNDLAGNRAYGISAGDALHDTWEIAEFENNHYHLRVYGPNGFYREFKGTGDDPHVEIVCEYEKQYSGLNKYSGNIILRIKNNSSANIKLEVFDNSYKTGTKTINTTAGKISTTAIDCSKSFGWYDFTIRTAGKENFEKTYAGKVENGRAAKTDPAMGKTI